jgi:hypothetical protein
VQKLVRLIQQWSWFRPSPGSAVSADPALEGLDDFLSEDEPLDRPAADGPSLSSLVAVMAACAILGVLTAFVSRPLWTTAEAAGSEIEATSSPAGGDAMASAAGVTDGAPGTAGAAVPADGVPEAPPAGELLIDTDPPGARVSVDREVIGVSPITVANLSAGSHEIVVESARGRVARTVQIKGGSQGSLVIAMTAANRFQSGWITVASAVPARIFEGGTLVGSTTVPRLMLPAGQHELEFVNDELGFHASRTIQVRAGQTETIDLETPNGNVFINARPWAEVFVDGRRVGETPIANLSLPIGQREIVFRHPQLGERRQTIVVSVGSPTRIGVELDR